MREADVRPADLLEEYLRLSAMDAKRLFATEETKIGRCCPGCDEANSEYQFTKNGFNIVRCSTCATLFVTPSPTGDALQSLYRDSPSAEYWANVFLPAVMEARRENIFKPRAREILDLVGQSGGQARRIIDVGAGTGLLIEELMKLSPETTFSAIEPGAIQSQRLREVGIETFEAYLEDLPQNSSLKHSADLVICCELIEHTTDSFGFVRSLKELVAPGGHILMTGLSASGFDVSILGERSNAISPPHHLTFLSQRGAEMLVNRTGLELVSLQTPGKLDVDIVRNALINSPDLEVDNFIRDLILEAEPEVLEAFQSFLSGNNLSSHMWILARN